MQSTTILLISSPHTNWVRLQTMLQKQRHLQVVGNVCQFDEGMHAATVEQPDVIIVASDLPGQPVVPLVEEMRATSSMSRIIVVGKLLDSVCHVRLTELGVRGFLVWKDVTAKTVRPLLEVVHQDMCVGSMAAVERRGVVDRRRGSRASDIVLTAEELGVLTGLADGWKQQEITERMHVSEATVKRIIAMLRSKFGVATTYALCAQAGRLGFLS